MRKMAAAIALFIRCRLKIRNLTQLTRSFSTTRQLNQKINNSGKFWFLISGGLLAFSYTKWQQLQTVYAFNPKKIKVREYIYFVSDTYKE